MVTLLICPQKGDFFFSIVYKYVLFVNITVIVTLNSVRRETVSALTIVSYDKVRGRNKAQR